jgi:hypothetical protein
LSPPDAAPSNDNGHNGTGRTNGQSNGQSNGNGKHRSNGRKATASQVRALHAIASRQGLDLAQTLHASFGVSRPDDLAIGQASDLIAELTGTGAQR